MIIGNINAVTYKEIFPLIKDNKMWRGISKTGMGFAQPDGTTAKLGFATWFTNLDHGRRHEPMQLMTMEDNKRYSKHKENPRWLNAYLKYDNYEAIEVPFSDSIPSDYAGAMGAPISFLDKYNPDQFEIVNSNDYRKNDKVAYKQHGLIKDKESSISGKPVYVRIIIKHKQPTTHEPNATYDHGG